MIAMQQLLQMQKIFFKNQSLTTLIQRNIQNFMQIHEWNAVYLHGFVRNVQLDSFKCLKEKAYNEK